MNEPVGNALAPLLRTMNPVLHAGTFAFTSVPPDTDLRGLDVIATMRETEGLTLVLREDAARARGWPVLFRAAWITLSVASDLHAVGLTAAVSAALAGAGIACNVIAGALHDHLFVPVERAADAMGVLRQLQVDAQSS